MGAYREVISELKEPTRSLRSASPEVWAGFGATREEVAEALGVALLMDGGTASVYGPRAWDAFEEFAPSAPGPGA